MQNTSLFRTTLLASAIAATAAHGQDGGNDALGADTELERISITGSRIKRTDMESVNPVLVLSAEDILGQGHANIYDALDSLSMNTVSFVGEENTNNFNANAMGLNLRGFGEGYTLVLINGKRVPILPKPQGAVAGNFVNLAMIPTAAVSRVEVLTGGASAIYGSDAVAGVVNIVTKQDIDYTDLQYRYGETTNGGGQSHRFTLVSGASWENTNLTFGVEADVRKPIYGSDRDWFDDPSDSPNPERHRLSQVMSFWKRYEPNAWMLNDLSDACAQQGYSSDRSAFYDTNTDWWGEDDPYYCGDNVYGEYSIRNGRDRYTAFANISHEINADTTLTADVMAFRGEADAGLYRYGYGLDYDVVDENGNWLGSRHIYRTFSRDELPTSDQEFEETTLLGNVNLEGALGEYFYNLTLTAGQYDYQDRVERFNDQAMMGILFGDAKGDVWDQPWLEESGSRWATVKRSQVDDRFIPTAVDFFGDINAADYTPALRDSVGDGESYLYSLSADVSGDLYQLDAGPVQFALVTELAREGYEYITDEATVNGELYGWSGIRGVGDRNRYSVGAELLIPIADSASSLGAIELKAAGRYDYYDDDSNVDGAFTYELGASWKPTDDLMVRASYATSFRAPDLHYLFGQPSSSFSSGVDYLSCLQSGNAADWDACGDTDSVNPRQYAQGDLNLVEETGHSASLGMVADISDGLSATVDFYEINLENKVGLIGTGTVLRYEAECMLGYDEFGNDIDGNSAKCEEMVNRVTRDQNDRVVSVTASPFNTGLREQLGMDATLRYHIDTDMGKFGANINYTHIFKTDEAYLPEDGIEDIRDAQWNSEFRTRTNGSFYWTGNDAWVSLYAYMLGTAPISSASEGRYGRQITWNLSAGHNITDELNLSISVVNLFDKRPPQAESDEYWPFFDVYKYSGTGREVFLSAKYRF